MSFALESRVDFSRQLATEPMPITKPANNDPEALKTVAEEFESIFMNMMLKSMRSANRTLSEGNYFNSFETKMYEDMLDEKLSVELGRNGGLGIADLLMRQFAPDERTPTYDLKLGQSDDPGVFPAERRAVFDGPQEFVASLLPKAISAAESLDIKPEFIVAQAALETGWGQHVMHTGNGDNSHNLFGIKAGSSWQGETMSLDSLEVERGVARQVTSQFRVYPDYETAFADYAKLISENDRYQAVPGSQDIETFASGLAEGGYATDPNYAAKVTRVMGELDVAHLALRKR
jgi:flagellar protein FlgJ